MPRGRWLLIGGLALWALSAGCARRVLLFQTPHDRALERELRRSRRSWVAKGLDTLKPKVTYLMPGQSIRIVIEGPILHEENKETWSFIRVDTFRIHWDSLAYLPWTGSFKIGGLSLDSAHVMIQGIVDKFYKNSKVRIYPLYPFYILGSVSSSGVFLYDRPVVTLKEIFPLLGTNHREVDWRRVKVLRGAMQDPYVALLDMRRADLIGEQFVIKAGDIIYFPPRRRTLIIEDAQYISMILSFIQLINIFFLFRFR